MSVGSERAFIDVRASFFPLAFLLFFCHPRIALDGVEVASDGWGTTRIPVSPGPHRIAVWAPYLYLKTMGYNEGVVQAQPGAIVSLHWRAPWIVFLDGKITVSGPVAAAGVAPGAAGALPMDAASPGAEPPTSSENVASQPLWPGAPDAAPTTGVPPAVTPPPPGTDGGRLKGSLSEKHPPRH